MTDDDLTRLRDEVAGVLGECHGCVVEDENTGRLLTCQGCAGRAQALLPLLARKIAEARGEALREAADDVFTEAGVQWGREDYRYWIRSRAALAEPTEPEGGR